MTSQPQEQAAAPLNPTVITVVQTAQQPGASYASRVPPKVLRAHRILGIMQIVVGSLDIVFNIASVITGWGRRVILTGGGIWSGPWFIAAGICGLVASRGPNNTLCCVNACLVLSIISAVTAFSAMITEAITAAANSMLTDGTVSPYLVYILGVLCTMLFAMELVVSIVHSAYACRASCCCVPQPESAPQQRQMYITNQPNAEPGQQVTYQPQPASAPQAMYPQVAYQQVGGYSTNEQAGGPPPYSADAPEKS